MSDVDKALGSLEEYRRRPGASDHPLRSARLKLSQRQLAFLENARNCWMTCDNKQMSGTTNFGADLIEAMSQALADALGRPVPGMVVRTADPREPRSISRSRLTEI